MAKLGGIIGVYQEADYLPYAIKQAEKMYDEIVIFEGCHSPHHPTRSTDGTIEIIEKSGHEYYLPENTSGDRYDKFQCDIWTQGVANVKAKGCDWFRFHDVDMFFMDFDASRLRQRVNRSTKDCIKFHERRFLFNWHISTHDVTGYFYRITPGMYLSPISRIYNNKNELVRETPERFEQVGISCFHFTQAKKLDRAEFRFQISKEKGTPGIDELWEKYKNFKIKSPDKIRSDEIEELVGGYGASWYDGEYPEVLDGHPYRFCNDIRKA